MNTFDLNLLGDKAKVCSFNCGYCELGTTESRLNRLKEQGFLPSREEILASAREAFKKAHEHGPMIDAIRLSGNGEPTLHPDFPEIVAGLIELRDLWLKGKKIAILTNGASLDQRKIAEAVNRLDERIVKVDAGNEKMFKTISAPLARVNLAKILSGIRSLKDVTVQAMFCQGAVDNTNSSDIEDWIEVIAIMKPKAVHIQTIRPSADRNTGLTTVSGITACDEDALHTIAHKLERRTGLRALVSL